MKDLNGVCIYECPTGLIPDANNFCVECHIMGKVNQNNNCVNSCNTDYMVDNSGKSICVLCSVMGKVNQGGNCQDNCNISYVDNGSKICVTW